MKLIKTISKLVGILFVGIMAGAVLLYIVFLLPTDGIFKHVQESERVFLIEGTYPEMDGATAKILDNWTDSLILENAFFEKEGAGTLEKALGVYRPEFKEGIPTNSLHRYLMGQEGYHTPSYARYWHGYLVIVKPLLTAMDYLGIRGFNRIVQMLVLLVSVLVLWRKLSGRYIVPFAAAILFMRPIAVAFSLQFSAVFYISVLSLIIMALFYERLKVGGRLLYFFMIVGIVTNYIDFLTYPIATLGFPLTLWLCFEKEQSCIEKIKRIVCYSACWGFGYFGMWIGKWLLGSLVLHRNVLADALEQARFRTSAETGQEMITRGAVIVRNLQTGFGGWEWLAVMGLIAIVLIGIFRTKGNLKAFILQSVPYVLVAGMPIAWYIVLSNHSFIHHWFTYRGLAVSVFALLAMGMTYWRQETDVAG